MTYGITSEAEAKATILNHTRRFGGELRVIFYYKDSSFYVEWSKGDKVVFEKFEGEDTVSWGEVMLDKIKQIL